MGDPLALTLASPVQGPSGSTQAYSRALRIPAPLSQPATSSPVISAPEGSRTPATQSSPAAEPARWKGGVAGLVQAPGAVLALKSQAFSVYAMSYGVQAARWPTTTWPDIPTPPGAPCAMQ